MLSLAPVSVWAVTKGAAAPFIPSFEWLSTFKLLLAIFFALPSLQAAVNG
jgi:hypothetical protein